MFCEGFPGGPDAAGCVGDDTDFLKNDLFIRLFYKRDVMWRLLAGQRGYTRGFVDEEGFGKGEAQRTVTFLLESSFSLYR